MTGRGKGGPAVSLSKWTRSISCGWPVSKFITSATLISTILALVAAAAAYVSLISAPGAVGVLGAVLALTMLAIAVIDLRSYIIPDALNATAGVLAILHAAAQEPEAMLQAIVVALLRGVVLAMMFLALRSGYARWRGRQGLGLGDVKLAFVAGAWLDWLTIPVAIQLAAFAALSAYLVRYLVSRKSLSATSRMPFGLFLAPAIWICWLLEVRWL